MRRSVREIRTCGASTTLSQRRDAIRSLRTLLRARARRLTGPACVVALMDHARHGDRIVLADLSRAGRRTSDLLTWVEDLDTRRIGLVVLILGIDTATPAGRLVVALLSAISEMEVSLLRERTVSGLAAARRRGRVGGRPRALTDEQVELARSLMAQGASATETARLLGGVCSERTVRRAVKAD